MRYPPVQVAIAAARIRPTRRAVPPFLWKCLRESRRLVGRGQRLRSIHGRTGFDGLRVGESRLKCNFDHIAEAPLAIGRWQRLARLQMVRHGENSQRPAAIARGQRV